MTEKNYNPEQGKTKNVKQETPKMKAEAPVKHDEKKETKVEEKKPVVKKEIVKKDEAVANGISLRVSTKDAKFICRFIKGKTIDRAVADLGEVMKFKKAIPMVGEIPHRKGKGIMSGRYPINAIEHFLTILKTLKANANVNGIEEPVIVEAVPNKASRPYGRFGAFQRKRTHVKIRVIEKSKLKKNKEKKK